MRKNLILLTGACYFIGSISASAVVLFAGWDSFPNAASSPATLLASETTATLSGSSDSGSWSTWNNSSGQGSSIDGTFGSLSTTVASASTVGGTATSGKLNLSLNRANKPGALTFTLTNTSDTDRLMDAFYFDGVGRFTQSAKDWTLSFSGAISGTAANGTLATTDMLAASAANRDWAIDLTGLTDKVWEAGSSAIFTLSFTGGDPAAGTGGGHETLIDNVGITATAVPEPSGLFLAAIGIAGLMLRRRK